MGIAIEWEADSVREWEADSERWGPCLCKIDVSTLPQWVGEETRKGITTILKEESGRVLDAGGAVKALNRIDIRAEIVVRRLIYCARDQREAIKTVNGRHADRRAIHSHFWTRLTPFRDAVHRTRTATYPSRDEAVKACIIAVKALKSIYFIDRC